MHNENVHIRLVRAEIKNHKQELRAQEKMEALHTMNKDKISIGKKKFKGLKILQIETKDLNSYNFFVNTISKVLMINFQIFQLIVQLYL